MPIGIRPWRTIGTAAVARTNVGTVPARPTPTPSSKEVLRVRPVISEVLRAPTVPVELTLLPSRGGQAVVTSVAPR
ncbi:MAG TPA: hypothetical protein VD931_15585 [Baekduia sp.]|nr:hypothetical protein [Baekduia sp.]